MTKPSSTEPRADWRRLAEDHHHLVRLVAGRLKGRLPAHIDINDCIGYGYIGLCSAAMKFDESKGTRFVTYASLRVRGAIIDGLRKMDRVPRSIRAHSNAVRHATDEMTVSLGREPTEEEVASRLGMTIARLRNVMDDIAPREYLSLEEYDYHGATGYDSEHPFASFLIDESLVQPHDALASQEIVTLILSALPPHERIVITMYYIENLFMREIGERLGVTAGRVCQVHARAMRRMRLHAARLIKE